MSDGDASLFILTAYGVTLVLIVAEVWGLVRRSRAQARELSSLEPRDEA
jgi:heme exporter protein CcmD